MKNKSQLSKLFLMGGLFFGVAGVQAADQIVCTKGEHAAVFEENMKAFAFSGDRFESVSPFQGWGENEKTIIENGVNRKYIRAQFTDRDDINNIGWIAADLVKEKAECPYYKNSSAVVSKQTPKRPLISSSATSVAGLSDPNCCRFPYASSAQADYTTDIRQFGWVRRIKGGGTRKHAASDLYHRLYEPVYAIADGEVLRNRTGLFAGNTTATEILHTGGFVARYAELATTTQKKGLVVPRRVKKGDLIGYIGYVAGARSPMLHFELYKGTVSGSLTTAVCRSGTFCRRSDLTNSAPYLQKWEASL